MTNVPDFVRDNVIALKARIAELEAELADTVGVADKYLSMCNYVRSELTLQSVAANNVGLRLLNTEARLAAVEAEAQTRQARFAELEAELAEANGRTRRAHITCDKLQAISVEKGKRLAAVIALDIERVICDNAPVWEIDFDAGPGFVCSVSDATVVITKAVRAAATGDTK